MNCGCKRGQHVTCSRSQNEYERAGTNFKSLAHMGTIEYCNRDFQTTCQDKEHLCAARGTDISFKIFLKTVSTTVLYYIECIYHSQPFGTGVPKANWSSVCQYMMSGEYSSTVSWQAERNPRSIAITQKAWTHPWTLFNWAKEGWKV